MSKTPKHNFGSVTEFTPGYWAGMGEENTGKVNALTAKMGSAVEQQVEAVRSAIAKQHCAAPGAEDKATTKAIKDAEAALEAKIDGYLKGHKETGENADRIKAVAKNLIKEYADNPQVECQSTPKDPRIAVSSRQRN